MKTLPMQLYIRSTRHWPRPGLMKPLKMDEDWSVQRLKPQQGGLWTSTYTPRRESESDWVRFARTGFPLSDHFFPYGPGKYWWLLQPRADARIYTINGLQSLVRLVHRYPHQMLLPAGLRQSLSRHFQFGIDFVRMAEDFDGVHLTERGHWRTRSTYPHNTNAWDCESTLWLRWSFVRAWRIPTPPISLSDALEDIVPDLLTRPLLNPDLMSYLPQETQDRVQQLLLSYLSQSALSTA